MAAVFQWTLEDGRRGKRKLDHESSPREHSNDKDNAHEAKTIKRADDLFTEYVFYDGLLQGQAILKFPAAPIAPKPKDSRRVKTTPVTKVPKERAIRVIDVEAMVEAKKKKRMAYYALNRENILTKQRELRKKKRQENANSPSVLARAMEIDRKRKEAKLRRKKRKRPKKLTISRKLKEFKKGAMMRGLKWEISDEEAIWLFNQPSEYCGREPIPSARKWNGIDRIENEKFYVHGNCASCCWPCNKAKGTLSGPEFIELCRKVADRWPRMLK